MFDLKQAVANYLNAVTDFNDFEREFPNDCTSRWDAKLYAKGDAFEALAAAYRADPLPEIVEPEPAPAPVVKKAKKVKETPAFELKVENGHYVSTKECARLMRAILNESFPKTKFSVRSETYSMGSHVSVSWEDGPTQSQVDAAIGEIRGRDFNGMDDSYTYLDHMWAGERIHFSGSGSSTSRSMSDMLRDITKINDMPSNERDQAYRTWRETSMEDPQPSKTLDLFRSFQKDAA